MMRLFFLTCGLLCATGLAQGPLSEPEREALLEKLENLRDEAKSSSSSRFSGATSAFQKGMASNGAALELYLKCVEKVNFEERSRSGQDFREWKRRNRRLEDETFAMALRHQLNWFSLTLEAAANPGKLDKLSPEAARTLASLMTTAEEVDSKAARDELMKPVTETIFAHAYGLGGLKIDNWPMTPLPIKDVYDKVILPPLRTPKTTESLREAWIDLIRYEGLIAERWRGNNDEAKNDKLSQAYLKFMAETRPELVWDMEVDIYKAGDQRGAALRMLEHLQQNITHSKATEWERSFRELVAPSTKPEVAGESASTVEPG